MNRENRLGLSRDNISVCVCGLIYLFKIEQLVVRFLWSLMTSNEQNILTKPFLPLSVSPSVSCFSSPLIVSLYKSLAASLIIFSLLVSCPFSRGFLFLCPCCRPVLLKRKQLLEKQQLFLFCVNAEQILTSSVIFLVTLLWVCTREVEWKCVTLHKC